MLPWRKGQRELETKKNRRDFIGNVGEHVADQQTVPLGKTDDEQQTVSPGEKIKRIMYTTILLLSLIPNFSCHEPDCAKYGNCRDKKIGGQGKKKQTCEKRRCIMSLKGIVTLFILKVQQSQKIHTQIKLVNYRSKSMPVLQ